METSTSVLATSLATPDDEASDEELAIEASSKEPFIASPTMSRTNSSWSFKQVHGSEGKLVRANVDAISK
jgi:hypothetical protein